MRIRLATPERFSFRRTVLSHGWCTLPPFTVADDGSWVATRARLRSGEAVALTLEEGEDSVTLTSPGRVTASARRELGATASAILNLELDLSEFYARCQKDADFRWIAESGAGRMLRGSSNFEDLVKLVLTTNCSWALTTKMTETLIGWLGDGAFPAPAALARAGAARLRSRGRLGYRAPYVAELARRVALGEVDPEGWSWGSDPAALKPELLALPGVGPYVAENLLKFLGIPDGLALDVWMRKKFARLHHGGRRVKDRTIGRRYARFGRWAGLAAWCELTRDWFAGDTPSAAWDRLA